MNGNTMGYNYEQVFRDAGDEQNRNNHGELKPLKSGYGLLSL